MATPVVSSLAALLASLGDSDPLQTIVDTSDRIGSRAPGQRINACRAVAQNGISCVPSGPGGGGTR